MSAKRTLSVLCFILLCACGVSERDPSATPYEPESTKPPTPASTNNPEPTETPIPTATATPIPTYSIDQAYQQIINWVENNGGCQLPCVWGFTPGQTNPADMDRLHSTFEKMYLSKDLGIWVDKYDDLGGLSLIAHSGDIQTNIDMSYDFKGEKRLKLIMFETNAYRVTGSGSEKVLEYLFGNQDLLDLVDTYTLSSILDTYGAPSSILIAPNYVSRPELPDPSWIWFSVDLIYEERGFLSEYIMPRRMISDSFAACAYQVAEISIVTWDPDQSVPLAEALSIKSGLGINEYLLDYFKPLEEATTLTIEEFTEIFQDPDTDACIYTPMELWPNP
ncbi:MAG: hypothetical protein PVG04_05990 [Anaerolineales bacterium]